MMTDKEIRTVEGTLEVLKKGEMVDAVNSPLRTPEPVKRLAILNRMLKKRADAETAFISSMQENVQAKMDYVRVREEAKDIGSILKSDKARRDGMLAESEMYRDSQMKLLEHAKKMDALTHEKLILQEEQEIERLKEKAEHRSLSLDARLAKESEEKLARGKAEKLLLIEEQKQRREMKTLIEEAKQDEVGTYVKRVKKDEERDVDPSDETTWSDRDRMKFESIDYDYAELMGEM